MMFKIREEKASGFHSVCSHREMMQRGLISFSVVLMILTEGSSVKVHPGGNTTLPCSIKDDQEITWIIITGNQTLVRIMRIEYGYGSEPKPEPSNIHPSYLGRIRALNSSRNTHSLLLMNITDSDLFIYCCTDCEHEQSHCTKLDYEDVEQQDTEQTEDIKSVCITIWLPGVCVLLLLSLMSNVCVCWRIKRPQTENLKTSKTLYKSTQNGQENEAEEISYASVNINKTRKNRGQHHPTEDTVYARIK